MKLYLMQHAPACSAAENPEKPLSPAGIDQAKAAAAGVKRLGLSFDLIITSPKRRAQQTAALIAERIRYPYSDILSTGAASPMALPDELLELLAQEDAEQILVVGHLPHLATLAGRLLSGAMLQFENTGLTCIEVTGNESTLVFHLTAAQLAS